MQFHSISMNSQSFGSNWKLNRNSGSEMLLKVIKDRNQFTMNPKRQSTRQQSIKRPFVRDRNPRHIMKKLSGICHTLTPHFPLSPLQKNFPIRNGTTSVIGISPRISEFARNYTAFSASDYFMEQLFVCFDRTLRERFDVIKRLSKLSCWVVCGSDLRDFPNWITAYIKRDMGCSKRKGALNVVEFVPFTESLNMHRQVGVFSAIQSNSCGWWRHIEQLYTCGVVQELDFINWSLNFREVPEWDWRRTMK